MLDTFIALAVGEVKAAAGNQTEKYIVANITYLGSTSGNLVGFTCTGRWLANGARINRIEIFPDGGTFTAPRAWLYGVRRQ